MSDHTRCTLRGVELRGHPAVLAVFAEAPDVMTAALAAVDMLLRAFGEHATGTAIEPVMPDDPSYPVRLHVLALTRLDFPTADALVSKAVDDWQALEVWQASEHAACSRITLGVEFVA